MAREYIRNSGTCVWDGCNNAAAVKMMCRKHYNKKRRNATRQPPRHGTLTMYRNHYCRCDLCRACWNGYCAANAARRRKTWTSEEWDKHNSGLSENRKRRKENIKEPELRDGICDLCGSEGNSLVVDHDHETDQIRGFLCSSCNTGLGKLGDNVEGLQRAIQYLTKEN